MQRRTYLKLGQMVKNGLTVPVALETIAQQQLDRGKSRATVAAVLTRWRRGILNGEPLAEAAKKDLPPADIILLRAGEKSGQLDRAITNILHLQDAVKKMKGAIRGGLAYPSVLLLLAFGLMNFVTYQMVPVYTEFAPTDKWTGAAAALASGAWFVANILPFILVLFGLFLAAALWSLPRWTGPLRQKFDSFIPWSIYKLFMGTGFLIALAGLVREGVKTNDALEIIMDGTAPWYRERLSTTLRRMEDGEKIATALYNSGFQFPDREIVDDLRAYENFDTFDSMIETLANDALETALQRVNAQMRVLFNIAIFVFGGVLMWYILGMAGMNAMIGEMAGK
jgi:type II secretory pathway component PulF